jgi:hypothetical protein
MLKKAHDLCGACNRGEPHGDLEERALFGRPALRSFVEVAYFELHGFWPEDS